jgi:CheY-like chemotaxis protein
MRRLHDSAMERAGGGETTLEEVERVVGIPPAPTETKEAVKAAAAPRILLVDDEKVNRKVARTLLQKNGFDVVECEDGQQGIDQLAKDPHFSLVLLDLAMPRMDGRAVLRWVRETPATRPLPVVVFTASQGEALEAEVMDEGADDYIRKPLDPPRFIARIRATLRRAAA